MSRHSEVLVDLLARQPMPAIIAAAREHEGEVLCVGGAVRDALLGRSAADIDVAVGGDLRGFIDAFARHCGRRPGAIGDPWRDTHRTLIGDRKVDIGRMLGDRVEDLSQRDFTINAMAVTLWPPDAAPFLIDLHGGVEDLNRRRIRMLSEDALRRDPLRMLRAVRYVATLEGFEIDAETEAAIAVRAPAIEDVAAERVQAEWALLLASPAWAHGLEGAVNLGLDGPTLGAPVNLRDALSWSAYERGGGAAGKSTEDLVALRLAALLPAGDDPALADAQRRLLERRWPLALARRARRIGSWARRLCNAGTAELTGWALEDRHSAAHAAALARALVPAERAGEAESSIAALEGYARRAEEDRWVNGDDLRRWGMHPGPELGKLLQTTARGQLERRWVAAEDAREWAQQRARRHGGPTDG